MKGFSNGTALTDIELDELQRNRRIRVRRDEYGGVRTFSRSYNKKMEKRSSVSGFILTFFRLKKTISQRSKNEDALNSAYASFNWLNELLFLETNCNVL